jgi:hypothetical protein
MPILFINASTVNARLPDGEHQAISAPTWSLDPIKGIVYFKINDLSVMGGVVSRPGDVGLGAFVGGATEISTKTKLD